MTFNDIFKSGFLESVSSFSVTDTIIGLLFSLVVGLFIFVIYKKTLTGVMYSTGFALTLVGMSMVTTLVIMAVTSNVVLSLGMNGGDGAADTGRKVHGGHGFLRLLSLAGERRQLTGKADQPFGLRADVARPFAFPLGQLDDLHIGLDDRDRRFQLVACARDKLLLPCEIQDKRADGRAGEGEGGDIGARLRLGERGGVVGVQTRRMLPSASAAAMKKRVRNGVSGERMGDLPPRGAGGAGFAVSASCVLSDGAPPFGAFGKRPSFCASRDSIPSMFCSVCRLLVSRMPQDTAMMTMAAESVATAMKRMRSLRIIAFPPGHSPRRAPSRMPTCAPISANFLRRLEMFTHTTLISTSAS